MKRSRHLLPVDLVRRGDGGQAGPAALAGGGSRSRQSGAAQPAGGGEEVGGPMSSLAPH